MKLQFSAKALETYSIVKKSSPNLAGHIKEIIEDTLLHPKNGIGDPICLEGEFKDVWQRKISCNEYLNYVFNDEVLIIASIKANISGQILPSNQLSIESFTEDRILQTTL